MGMVGSIANCFFFPAPVRRKQDDHYQGGDKYNDFPEWFELWERHFRFGVFFFSLPLCERWSLVG